MKRIWEKLEKSVFNIDISKVGWQSCDFKKGNKVIYFIQSKPYIHKLSNF